MTHAPTTGNLPRALRIHASGSSTWIETGGTGRSETTLVLLKRAPLIAFLNHDDLWLPNHLMSCREGLEAVQADMVLGTAANIASSSPLPLQFESMLINLEGLGVDNRWSPTELDAGVVV